MTRSGRPSIRTTASTRWQPCSNMAPAKLLANPVGPPHLRGCSLWPERKKKSRRGSVPGGVEEGIQAGIVPPHVTHLDHAPLLRGARFRISSKVAREAAGGFSMWTCLPASRARGHRGVSADLGLDDQRLAFHGEVREGHPTCRCRICGSGTRDSSANADDFKIRRAGATSYFPAKCEYAAPRKPGGFCGQARQFRSGEYGSGGCGDPRWERAAGGHARFRGFVPGGGITGRISAAFEWEACRGVELRRETSGG